MVQSTKYDGRFEYEVEVFCANRDNWKSKDFVSLLKTFFLTPEKRMAIKKP